MSRAFVKEDGPDNEPLPDLPISPHPNYVTPRGLAALRSRLTETQAQLATLKTRTERLDRLPEKAAERDIRYLEARLATAEYRQKLADANLPPMPEYEPPEEPPGVCARLQGLAVCPKRGLRLS